MQKGKKKQLPLKDAEKDIIADVSQWILQNLN